MPRVLSVLSVMKGIDQKTTIRANGRHQLGDALKSNGTLPATSIGPEITETVEPAMSTVYGAASDPRSPHPPGS